ncbi:hypothetical protein MVEN_01331100 [Mycena venus]|uniref:DUF6533 domain-containing protein n=1 Tax=Mycena venus TaxID=2733690 RepID=A0A8H6Y1H6_9AGAR|nr:hypothetical protein MVEN_01331100 [Mycena venus]
MTAQVQAVTEAQKIVLLNYGHLVGLTVLFLDHLLTLDAEINLLWRRRKGLSAYCFYINRYFGLFSSIAVSPEPFITISTESCVRYSFFSGGHPGGDGDNIWDNHDHPRVCPVWSEPTNTVVHGWNRGGSGGSMCVFGHPTARISTNGFGRMSFRSDKRNVWQPPWDGLLLFDTVTFGLTMYNGYVNQKILPSSNLHMVVVHDGAMYFAIMGLANLANIGTYYFAESGLVSPGSLATFANCISVTMISRLILNLHEHASSGIMSESTGTGAVGQIQNSNFPSLTIPDSDSQFSHPDPHPGGLVVSRPN